MRSIIFLVPLSFQNIHLNVMYKIKYLVFWHRKILNRCLSRTLFFSIFRIYCIYRFLFIFFCTHLILCCSCLFHIMKPSFCYFQVRILKFGKNFSQQNGNLNIKRYSWMRSHFLAIFHINLYVRTNLILFVLKNVFQHWFLKKFYIFHVFSSELF